MKLLMLMIATVVLSIGCSGDDDRQEVLAKLRGLGAETSPLVTTPSASSDALKEVEVTVYAALPEGQTATIEPYLDTPSPFAVSLPVERIEIKTESVIYAPYSGFQVMSFKATLKVPGTAAFERLGGAGQVRYGFTLRSGDEEEKLTGSYLVYPEGSEELAWVHPEVALAAPLDGATVKVGEKIDLAAMLTEKNGEELKVGWFASAGKIMNRRAKSTTWELKDAGSHSLIVTARGKKSRGFAMKIVTVTAE